MFHELPLPSAPIGAFEAFLALLFGRSVVICTTARFTREQVAARLWKNRFYIGRLRYG
jgi:hypothetical protein